MEWRRFEGRSVCRRRCRGDRCSVADGVDFGMVEFDLRLPFLVCAFKTHFLYEPQAVGVLLGAFQLKRPPWGEGAFFKPTGLQREAVFRIEPDKHMAAFAGRIRKFHDTAVPLTAFAARHLLDEVPVDERKRQIFRFDAEIEKAGLLLLFRQIERDGGFGAVGRILLLHGVDVLVVKDDLRMHGRFGKRDADADDAFSQGGVLMGVGDSAGDFAPCVRAQRVADDLQEFLRRDFVQIMFLVVRRFFRMENPPENIVTVPPDDWMNWEKYARPFLIYNGWSHKEPDYIIPSRVTEEVPLVYPMQADILFIPQNSPKQEKALEFICHYIRLINETVPTEKMTSEAREYPEWRSMLLADEEAPEAYREMTEHMELSHWDYELPNTQKIYTPLLRISSRKAFAPANPFTCLSIHLALPGNSRLNSANASS